MFDFKYDYIYEDFLKAYDGTSSDSCYVLRKMLLRGASEAMFRFHCSDGDKSFGYRHLSWELDELSDKLDDMFDEHGEIPIEHRVTLMKAIKLCQCLLAVDQAETNADYSNLADFLTDDLDEISRIALLAVQ